jgi:phospholipase C
VNCRLPHLDVRAQQYGDALVLELVNLSSKPLTLKVKARGYGSKTVPVELGGKQTRTLPWPTNQGWYDVEVTTAEDTSYRRRLTGHLETGKPRVTG